MRSEPRTAAGTGDAGTRRRGWAAALGLLLPALAAIWAVPWFVTQDGPEHVYNAHIFAASLRPGSPFREVYAVRWAPFPNWAGHLTLAGLMAVLPPRDADRMAMTLTLAGFAGAVLWLRWRVAGWRGMPLAAALAVLLALNVMWLEGFYGFLLGASLFPIALGVWWGGRARLGPGRATALAGLQVAGYFCHPVGLGATVVGLGVLALATPGPGRARRLGWTLAGFAPLIPLAIAYRAAMRGEGAVRVGGWWETPGPWTLKSLAFVRLVSVDPLSLDGTRFLPFLAARKPWANLSPPVLAFGAALALLVAATLAAPRRDRPGSGTGTDPGSPGRRGWGVVAGLLLLGGLLGPENLGAGHGSYLDQRVLLLGLVALVPWLELDGTRWPGRAAGVTLALAVALQSAFVWDYALTSGRRAGAFMRAAPHVGTGQRVATLILDRRSTFRAHPTLHIDGMLGVGTGNVIWNNYEATRYYFPVQYGTDPGRRVALAFDQVQGDAPDSPAFLDHWARLLAHHHEQCDVLVVWGDSPTIDAVNARWFRPVFCGDGVQVHRRRPAGPPPTAPPK